MIESGNAAANEELDNAVDWLILERGSNEEQDNSMDWLPHGQKKGIPWLE